MTKTYAINKEDKTSVIRALNSGTMQERIAAAVLLHNMPEQPLPLITGEPVNIDAIAVNLMRFAGIDKHQAYDYYY